MLVQYDVVLAVEYWYRSIKNRLSIDPVWSIDRKLIEYWSRTIDSIDPVRSIDRKLLEYWYRTINRSIENCLSIDITVNQRVEIAWVSAAIDRSIENWLSIEINRTRRVIDDKLVECRCDRTQGDAWVLKLITIDRSKLLEYQTRSRRRLLEYWYRSNATLNRRLNIDIAISCM